MSSIGSASTRKTEPRAISAARAGSLRGLPERALLLPLLPEPLPRPDDSAERARAARAGLLVMTGLLLVGVCMVLAFNRGRLADYRPPDFLIDTVDLVFDLGDAETRVKSRLLLRRNPSAADRAAPLGLDGDTLWIVAEHGRRLGLRTGVSGRSAG